MLTWHGLIRPEYVASELPSWSWASILALYDMILLTNSQMKIYDNDASTYHSVNLDKGRSQAFSYSLAGRPPA
jgi:hypothetical protein